MHICFQKVEKEKQKVSDQQTLKDNIKSVTTVEGSAVS